MKPRPEHDGWRLTLEASNAKAWAAVPGEIRLRRALKVLLRSFGLRVLKVEAAGNDEGKDAA